MCGKALSPPIYGNRRPFARYGRLRFYGFYATESRISCV